MIYLDNNTELQDLYIPRQAAAAVSGSTDWASREYVNELMKAETARTEDTYAKKEELSAYTPTTGFTTINGSAITIGGNIEIEGTNYVGGDNISVSGNVISVTGIPTEFKTINGSAITGNGDLVIEGKVYSAGTNINIDEYDVISVTGITVPTKVSDLENDEGFLTSDSISGYSTTSEVEGMISAATAATTGWVEDQHYLTEHQSLSAYSTTDEVEGMISAATASTTGWVADQHYLTEHQSLSAYSTTDEVEAMVSAATAATTGWVASQGYLTEHQSLSAYSTTEQVDGMISAATASTTGWVESQGYITEHQSLSAYTPTSGFSTVNGSAITSGGNITIDTSSTVELTQDEYDALTAKTAGTLYVITDADPIDIDNLASKRLQELDAAPSSPSDGDVVNFEDGLYKYVDGSGQTGFWSTTNGSQISANTTDLGFALAFSHIPNGQQILEFRRYNNGNWKQFKMQNGVINVYDNSGSTPSTAITKNSGVVRVNSLSSSSYWIEIDYRDNYIGFYKNSNTQLQNMWDGITSGAHYEKIAIPEPLPFINAGHDGIPRWNQRGEIIGLKSAANTKTIYINSTGTTVSVRWDIFYGNNGNAPARMFVPTQSGTQGQVLTSAGNAEPTWQTMIKAVKISSDDYDALVQAGTTDANTLYLIVD